MILPYEGERPVIDASCFIANSAEVIGNVHIEKESSVWYGCVLRGDENAIKIGSHSNIQDGTIIHISHKHETIIGDYVTVGHKAIVHACTIGNNVLVGMGSIILNGAIIEDNVLVGAGSIVTPGKCIPSGTLVLGSPAKVVRNLSEEEIKGLKQSAIDYVSFAKRHNVKDNK